MKIIADSGSTKCAWLFIDGVHTREVRTRGINAVQHSAEQIREALAELPPCDGVTSVKFYGAGCGECMDQMMVDVTDIPGVQAGDTVTLIGTDGDETISMEEIAAAAGSFNYEFACGISRRVPRVYLRGGQAVHTVHYLTDVFQEEPHGT